MEQAIRNKLRNVVTQCRKLLEESVRLELQGRFGIYAAKKNDIQVDDDARMTHLETDDLAARKDILDHLSHITARGFNPKEGLEQLVREIAFTHLNRLCAYKMMEARKVHVGGAKFREAVSRGLKSQGFLFYLADHPEYEQLYKSGKQDLAYRKFLDWLGETLSEEIGVLFNSSDPANRIYPPQRVLDEVLDLINCEELNDVWTEDETIGWVYQYFTPKELRDKARKESQAPRNSYELAFRNQFFTPRYVVEFLTDNTLGRIWYEMRKGNTSLTERCRYLVRRPTELFLKEGEEPPADSNDAREDLSQEELLKQPVSILHRPKKDPRQIKILDPACGSGHFLLYCFDLLVIIYEEAYQDPDLVEALKRDYPNRDDFRRQVPGLILRHNLHGIDIDLRATQIAALALWLRCQRAYRELELQNGERLTITRSNIVCAEPMPGETDLLKEFTATLQPKVLGQLVELIFEKMKLAGEAGSLLKIDEDIREAAMTAKNEYQNELLLQKEHEGYLPGMAPPRERTIFDFSDMTDSEFLDRAEIELVAALRQYTETGSHESGYRKRLFAEDAARGFSFLDVCRKKFDVVLMNPPFGEAAALSTSFVELAYPAYSKNILCSFIERSQELLAPFGMAGSVIDRTILIKNSYEKFRRRQLLDNSMLTYVLDLGWGVLDANVEVASVILLKACDVNGSALGIDVTRSTEKGSELENQLVIPILLSHDALKNQPFAAINFRLPDYLRSALRSAPSFAEAGIVFYNGHTIKSDVFKRLFWEISPLCLKVNASRMWNGSEYAPIYVPFQECVILNGYAGGLDAHKSTILRNPSKHLAAGLCFGKRGEYLDVQVLPAGFVLTNEGFGCPASQSDVTWYSLAILNSLPAQAAINFYCGQHKGVGYVNSLPLPGLNSRNSNRLVELVKETYHELRRASRALETDPFFITPFLINSDGTPKSSQDWCLVYQQLSSKIRQAFTEIDSVCMDLFGVSPEEAEALSESAHNRPTSVMLCGLNKVNAESVKTFWAQEVSSYLLGISYGRWDVRFATGECQPPLLPDPLDPLPICPPGLLVGLDGLPALPGQAPSEYPVMISWDGILLDDPEHKNDIIRHIRDVLEVIWQDSAEAIEKEVCEILGARELRDYFRKPGNGGFWMDHVKRYSKSRRKAPIYWYLRSAKGNYGLWLYYHRLDKDILFKALLNHVEPKIRMEEERLKEFRVKKQAAGSAGNEAKQIEKDMDRQEQFVSELQEFSDKLRRAADLHLDPDLNDGVVLNIAPLWELVPWKEAKKYWEELLEGKYEWSSIGKQLREKGIVRK